MSTDLDIIKQLEQTIGKKLKKLDEVYWSSGYQLNNQQQVIRLDLSHCQLGYLPKEIGQLHNLKVLNLQNCDLTQLPKEIGQLSKLELLNLEWNKLTQLPKEIGQLSKLERLILCSNKLTQLPKEIGQLSKLELLDLEHNELKELLPEEIIHLNLKIYDTFTHRIDEYLDFELDEKEKLLFLEEIGIQTIWDGDEYACGIVGFVYDGDYFESLSDLDFIEDEFKFKYGGIYINDDVMVVPPDEIIAQGKEAIANYYNALKSAEKPLNEAKLILIGDGGTGKTSLMKRLFGLDFNPQESQTHGININTLILKHNDNDIKLHCWDFGGQQIMHATHQFFLSKRSLYLLVLDSRRETQVDYWLKHIQTFGKNAPVIIVINKIDENPHFDLPQQRQLKKRYPNIKQICRISCAMQQGMSELNRAIQNTLPDIELLNTVFPAKWFKVKTAITEQAEKTNFTSYEHYVDICQANGISKESEQNTLINFLHDLGLVNHFQDRWLRETNVINPQWITEAVYTIINAPQLAGDGKLHREHLTTLLDNTTYPVRKHDYIIELMKKFELCYALNDNEYLLPDLFSTQEPEFEFDDEHALQFILEYDFLPKSIFTRFIVRMHRDILDNTYWRNGVLLCDRASDTTALVETVSDRLVLQITGQQKREYLAILRFVLEDIRHSSFSHLNVTEKIGLPDNPQITVNHDYLVKLAQNGHCEYLPPENPEKYYNIMDLLGIVAPQKNSETEIMQMLQKILSILETQGIEPEKDLLDHINEVVKLNPGMFGMSIDVNALVKKLLRK
jgi:small GTP-binding protein